jgi:putative copper export protein
MPAAVVMVATSPTLAPGLDGFRLILHVLAATIWVGGQFTVAGLLPTIRTLGDDAPKKVARAFGRLLWPAYGVLLLTGFWNISAVDAKHASSAWNAVLGIKIAVVLIAGVAVFLHQRSTSKVDLAVWGAIGALASVAALCLGVFLAG